MRVKGSDEGLGSSESRRLLGLAVDDGLHVGLARGGARVPFLRSRPGVDKGKGGFLYNVPAGVVVPHEGGLGSFTRTSRCDRGTCPGSSLVSSRSSSVGLSSIVAIKDALKVGLGGCRAEVLAEVLLHVGQSGVGGGPDHLGKGRLGTAGPQAGGVVDVGGALPCPGASCEDEEAVLGGRKSERGKRSKEQEFHG